MTANFQISALPQIKFGWGIRQQFMDTLIAEQHAHLIIISSRFLTQAEQFSTQLIKQLQENGTRVQLFSVSGEPSPELVDYIVENSSLQAESVIGIGGGSVLDTAKAVAGLIPSQRSVLDFLEGVGKGMAFDVETLPFIALPTTAGTGSETSKNSVLSKIGEFKKSFRSEKLIAKQVWLDPEFLISCPKNILYTTGMDAFTQLLESYTTLNANPITDALAWQGMTLFKNAFADIDSDNKEKQQTGYGNLMLAANLSGTTLANAGLGAVHGLAGPIGAYFVAPHGEVCAALLAPITQINIQRLQTKTDSDNSNFLEKYANIGRLFSENSSQSTTEALEFLVNFLNQLTQQYSPQSLTDFGINQQNITSVIKVCRSGSMLGNPVILTDDELLAAIFNG